MNLNNWKPCFVHDRRLYPMSNDGPRTMLSETSFRWQQMSLWNRHKRMVYQLNGHPRQLRPPAKSSSICMEGDMPGVP